MSHLILHLGHAKTGTTSLQFALQGNRDLLLKSGILYPYSGDHKHVFAAPHLMDHTNPAIVRRMRSGNRSVAGKSRKVWGRIVKDCRRSDANTIVLSGEGFWGAPSRDAVAEMREKLGEICETAEAVAYLRSPVQLFLSRLNQRMRMTQTIPSVSRRYYKKPIMVYDNNGFEKLSLHIFDRDNLIGGDIIEDFCTRHLMDLSEPLDRSVVKRANESVSAEAMTVIDEYKIPDRGLKPNARRTLRIRIVHVVRDADRQLENKGRPKLFPEVADAIVARSEDLTWLRDERGFEFPDVDYSRVGGASDVRLDELNRVADFCPVDEGRLSELRELVKEELGPI